MSDEESIVWWGTCDKCLTTTMAITQHPDAHADWREVFDDRSEWEDTLPSCPVCGAYVDLGNSDVRKGFRL